MIPAIWLVRQIGRGRSPSLRTVDRVLAFMAECDGDPGRHPGPTAAQAGPQAFIKRRRTKARRATTEQPIEQRTNPPTRFLRLPEVQHRTGLSRSTIYVRLNQGLLSPPGRARRACRGLDRGGGGRVDPRADQGRPRR